MNFAFGGIGSNPKFFERGQRGQLLGLLLARTPCACKSARSGQDADLKALRVVRALLVEHHVLRRAHFKLCEALLQHLLEILLVPQSQRRINPQRQARQHECARGFQSAVEVQRADHGFKDTC